MSMRLSIAGALVAFAVVLNIIGVPASASAESSEELTARETLALQQICAPCHARPGIGVPLIGDFKAWRARRLKGLDKLLENTIEGKGGMPPLGTCSFCSRDELRRLVQLIAGLSEESPK